MSAEAVPAVHRAIVLPITRAEAWAAITDADELAQWLADDVELDPREGGDATFRWDDGETRIGVVEEVAPERRLAFRWREEHDHDAVGESLVELTLDDVEDGTRVSVVELPTASLCARGPLLAPASASSAWSPRMGALSAALAGTCA